jgi:demethylmenaquinone methyltransferase / 2-methoxy-6-polyprenyl-1,4-benzoquinol methylase
LKHDKITPYQSDKEKQQQVAEMFNNIANRYDLLNSLLSMGIHKGWRRKCVNLLAKRKPSAILDVATGTGDFAIACAKLNPANITGIDISEGMLAFGREKIKKLGLDRLILLEAGNAETYDAADNSFDAITVGFGVRNFQDLKKGLRNLLRLLKPGGTLVVLEFSYPTNFFVKGMYNFYLGYMTPLTGRLLSKDTRAYSYLAESVKAFPHNEDFVNVMKHCGFVNCSFETLSMGIAGIYAGEKQSSLSEK